MFCLNRINNVEMDNMANAASLSSSSLSVGGAWNKTPTASPCSLREVMSEELVTQLQKEEATLENLVYSR